MQTLSVEVEAVSERYYQDEAVDDSELAKRVEKADGILQALLQFCQRNSGRMDEKARQVGVVILIVLVCSLSWLWSCLMSLTGYVVPYV